VTADQVVAVDWSGRADAAGQRRAIWTAVARGGGLAELRDGRDRREAVDHLIRLARATPATVAGLDFAFSWPAWYLDARGLRDPAATWSHAGELALLRGRDLPRPFWGANVRPKAEAGLGRRPVYRATERAAIAAGAGVRSTFQAGGNGTVGLQSIRGMAHLGELRAAGVRVWPFDDAPPGRPLALEIFPRMLARSLVQGARSTGAAFRAEVLEAVADDLGDHRATMLGNQDAFDAGISAIVMWRRRRELAGLRAGTGAHAREGRIWGVAA
jgi:hypothetical protein